MFCICFRIPPVRVVICRLPASPTGAKLRSAFKNHDVTRRPANSNGFSDGPLEMSCGLLYQDLLTVVEHDPIIHVAGNKAARLNTPGQRGLRESLKADAFRPDS